MKRSLISLAVPFAAATCFAATFAMPATAGVARPHVAEPTLVEGPFHTDPGTYADIVPAGVTSMVVEAVGASGGNGGTGTTVQVGGVGDDIKGQVTVTPGETITSVVGAHGADGCRSSCSGNTAAGVGGAGFSAGGDGSNSGAVIGAGGGGSSSVTLGAATTPSFVGAGGGGGGATSVAVASSSAGTGNAGGDGDAGTVPSGSGGGGGGLPGGPGGTLGGGGQSGTSVGPNLGIDRNLLDGDVQLAYYEPGLDAADDEYSVKTGTTLSVPAPGVLKNDDAFGLVPKIARTAQHGAVSLSPDGAFTYKPTVGFTGYDTFTYALGDADRRATATVTILVGKVAAAALTEIGVPGKGVLILGLACGPAAKCPFDVAILKKVGSSVKRIAHGTATFAAKSSALFSFQLPQSTRKTFGTGKSLAVHATLYVTVHRKGQKVIVVAQRPIVIK